MALIEISSMPSNVFEDAVVDTIIFQGRSYKYANTTFIKKCFDHKFLYQNSYVQKEFLNNDNFSINIQLD